MSFGALATSDPCGSGGGSGQERDHLATIDFRWVGVSSQRISLVCSVVGHVVLPLLLVSNLVVA